MPRLDHTKIGKILTSCVDEIPVQLHIHTHNPSGEHPYLLLQPMSIKHEAPSDCHSSVWMRQGLIALCCLQWLAHSSASTTGDNLVTSPVHIQGEPVEHLLVELTM